KNGHFVVEHYYKKDPPRSLYQTPQSLTMLHCKSKQKEIKEVYYAVPPHKNINTTTAVAFHYTQKNKK
ncbi:hypothetical protein ACMBCN_00775, partial [Candidatus Liberibacter asiaticus]